MNDGSSQASLTLVSCGVVANPTRVAASDIAQIQTDDRIHIRVHPLAAADTVTRPTVAQKPEALIENPARPAVTVRQYSRARIGPLRRVYTGLT